MNEITYLLAVLVVKDILSVDEAKKIQAEMTKGVISSDLGHMVTKVKTALENKESDVKKIDAKEFLS